MAAQQRVRIHDVPRTRCALGHAFLVASDDENAIVTLDQAIVRLGAPTEERARRVLAACLFDRGRASEGLGDTRAARRAYERSLALRASEAVSRRLAMLPAHAEPPVGTACLTDASAYFTPVSAVELAAEAFAQRTSSMVCESFRQLTEDGTRASVYEVASTIRGRFQGGAIPVLLLCRSGGCVGGAISSLGVLYPSPGEHRERRMLEMRLVTARGISFFIVRVFEHIDAEYDGARETIRDGVDLHVRYLREGALTGFDIHAGFTGSSLETRLTIGDDATLTARAVGDAYLIGATALYQRLQVPTQFEALACSTPPCRQDWRVEGD